MNTYNCSTCLQECDMRNFNNHLIRCAYQYLSSQGLPISCTCSECEGKHVHPSSTSRSVNKLSLKRKNDTIQISDTEEEEEDEHGANDSAVDSPATLFFMRDGKFCIQCRAKKYMSTVAFPIIRIGKFRKYIICIKQHLVNGNQLENVLDFLDQEARSVRENDSPISEDAIKINEQKYLDTSLSDESVVNDGNSETEDEEPEATTTNTTTTSSNSTASTRTIFECGGISKISDKSSAPIRCLKKGNHIIFIELDGKRSKLYFCGVVHLCNYLVQNYCGMGKSPKVDNKAEANEERLKKKLKKSNEELEELRSKVLAAEECSYSNFVLNKCNDQEFISLIGVGKELYFKLLNLYINSPTCDMNMTIKKANINVLLFFTYMKHFPTNQFLGAIFGLSRQTASNTWKSMLVKYRILLAGYLTISKSRFNSGNYVNGCLITYLIDGSEQSISASGNPSIDTRYYSQKKCKTTVFYPLLNSFELL